MGMAFLIINTTQQPGGARYLSFSFFSVINTLQKQLTEKVFISANSVQL